ncbi:A/G-specific adenine glycosylase [Nannocystis punicea]|uniref:Adenine DNA glycosylase n=1 Tax=Nannocystis punicea TaxID=2995304 RepID=A0ABY7H7X5_9BACT|nr:A/G-specific adenine glycosylase [Nannocystis poenicansa]WAS95362.1 A/G-specific adenine glycosylase [Nannocystis poenicansa]
MLDFAHRIAKHLEPWFLQHQRDLTWRRTRDPYAIWVSEIMLQQTRVDTVEAYYGKFLDRFPDVGTLAAADESDVLAAWSGLGYYRRARLLHAGARHVAENLGGVVPDEPDQLRKIPGVGKYTAGAIASIAFDRPAGLVDGNVARVLSRLQAIEEPRLQDASSAGHWAMAQKIVQAGSPRVLAQALMELGATVCTPMAPRCEGCPVRSECQALAKGLQTAIPAPKQRAPSPREDLWAVAVRRDGRVLLEQRPTEGLLAGLWCLPLIERKISDRAGAPPRSIAEVTGVKVKSVEALAEPVKHVFTHRVWMLWPCRGEAAIVDMSHQTDEGDTPGRMWIAPGERPRGGIPKVTEKVLARLGF